MKKAILTITLLMPLSAMAVEWSGTVVGISDGDTVKVINDKKQSIKIRLVEIDAPEKNQAFGEQSKQSLSNICFKKSAVVDDKGLDKYKRTLGRLRCDGVDANAEQVKRGMAWAYRQYLTDPAISGLEEAAKTNKLGLWVDENPTPPWEFRHGKKPKAKATYNEVSDNSEDTCGGKIKCGEMSNCAEAKHYLNDCGVSRLDRDNDGIPCESICR